MPNGQLKPVGLCLYPGAFLTAHSAIENAWLAIRPNRCFSLNRIGVKRNSVLWSSDYSSPLYNVIVQQSKSCPGSDLLLLNIYAEGRPIASLSTFAFYDV